MKVRRRADGVVCAVKHIKNVFKNGYLAKTVLREICILRKLTELKENNFTVKLLDVIFPVDSSSELKDVDDVFLVMDHFGYNLKDIMVKSSSTFDEGHIKVILYNLTCALAFIHSTGLMHRDFKPGNILLDSECNIRLCDFGMSRVVPDDIQLREDFYRYGDAASQIMTVPTEQYDTPSTTASGATATSGNSPKELSNSKLQGKPI